MLLVMTMSAILFACLSVHAATPDLGFPRASTTAGRGLITSRPANAGSPVLLAQYPPESEEPVYDVTPPVSSAVVVPSPNAEGWNNTDVTVTVTAEDEESGIRETTYSLSGAQTGGGTIYSGVASFGISAEGVTTVTFSAGDNADNQEAARTLTVQIDKSPPHVGLACPATVSLRSGEGAVVNVTDALSGIASQTSANGTVFLDTSAVGATTFAVTAQDRAGNAASGACSYRVVYNTAGAGGFKPPVIPPPGVNAVKAGSTVPVTWQLPDGAGGFVSDLGVVVDVAVRRVQCPEIPAASAKELPSLAAGGSSVLHYDAASSHFVYYWRTEPSMRGHCYSLTLSLDDGMEHTAHFAVR